MLSVSRIQTFVADANSIACCVQNNVCIKNPSHRALFGKHDFQKNFEEKLTNFEVYIKLSGTI